jgi:heat shock protein HtpX
MPKVYRIPQPTPNAFATGRNPQNAVVAVTDGIRSLLTADELSGVIGHELAHIGHRDILISSIAATLAGAIMMLANMAKWALIFGGGRDEDSNPLGALFMAILAPVAAVIIQMAVSRSREYQADQTGAKIAGNPDSLASALEKLSMASKRVPMAASPATSHMFIVRPFSGQSLLSLFSTHPPVEKRVERLRGMKRGG